MKRILFIFASWILLANQSFAISASDIGFQWQAPEWTIMNGSKSVINVLSIIQSVLLKVVLPIVVVGTALYVAYELFTADGDESKMKKAWKSLVYSAIALIAIALSYALVSIISTIELQ